MGNLTEEAVGDGQCGFDAVGTSRWLTSMPLGVDVVRIEVAAINVARVDVAAVDAADVGVACINMADVDVAHVDVAHVDVAPSTWISSTLGGRWGSTWLTSSYHPLCIDSPPHPTTTSVPSLLVFLFLCPIIVGRRGGR